ncbi:very short patch repair endonuclease [Xanthobacter autotrophicus DSM 431]|uniref:very short patch repair endonuclease n=1 Tax=Xanthobacter nonsaccharivorans TaxID=3119912 RepID=UPI0037272856
MADDEEVLRIARNPDPLTPEQRRRNMSRIRAHDTQPEMLLRQHLHAAGLRYRIHDRRLAGTPDLVFPGRKAVIFVHGCFWHGHGCPKSVTPATNTAFWVEKITRNRQRDEAVDRALRAAGWRILTVWECALRGRARRTMPQVTQGVIAWLEAGLAEGEVSGDWSAMS